MVSETSRDAFRHGRDTGQHDRDRQRVLAAITDAGGRGLTQDETEALLNPHEGTKTFSQRFSELRRSGQIATIGQRRKTRKGRMAEVYVASGVEPEPIRVFGHVWKDGKWRKG